MKLQRGNLWNAPEEVGATLLAVTTNSYVRKDGALTMGKGAAGEARERLWPRIDYVAGAAVLKLAGYPAGVYGPMPPYGWLVTQDPRLGLFQTKNHFQQQARLELIRFSVGKLLRWLDAHPAEVVALNFPGIGEGRLPREEVLPLVELLPDRVVIYERS